MIPPVLLTSQVRPVSNGEPDLSALAAPFPAAAVEWVVIESKLYDGKPGVTVAAFLDARSIMERLDAVVGPAGWQTDIKAAPNSLDGVLYGLSLYLNGQWVTKYDGADIPPVKGERQADRTKSALTAGIRRAAMLWGIGRYLWALPKRQYAVTSDRKSDRTPFFHVIKPKRDDKWQPMKIWWGSPVLPAWALPAPTLSVSSGTTALPAPVTDAQAAPERATAPTAVGAMLRCPACNSTMWDNRLERDARNEKRAATGKAPVGMPGYPDYKCKNADCQLKLDRTDIDPATGALTVEARDRLELDEA